MRAAYSLLLTLALPLIALRLWWRGRLQPGYRQHIGERFGRFPTAAAQGAAQGAIWIHAVSVGETRAAKPLIDALKTRYPGRPLLLTCMTPAGRQTARELFGDSVTIAFLPYDLFGWQSRFIRHYRPALLLVMETEIWPNLFAACAAARLPALLVNARLSARSLARYQRFAPVAALAREALQSLHAISAQSKDDAERLTALGARNVTVNGNLKFDLSVDPHALERGNAWRKDVSRPRVLLLASTREGEEATLLEAYQRAFSSSQCAGILLVVVPRHPQRFEDVRLQLTASGLRVGRRSQSSPQDCDIWLGDSMGEMAAYFAMCDLAIVGGSFANLGGQNFIEACALGKAVVLGPHTFNFAEATVLAKQEGAILQCVDAGSALAAARDLLNDDARRKQMGEAGLRFASAHKGATQKTMELIAPLSSD